MLCCQRVSTSAQSSDLVSSVCPVAPTVSRKANGLCSGKTYTSSSCCLQEDPAADTSSQQLVHLAFFIGSALALPKVCSNFYCHGEHSTRTLYHLSNPYFNCKKPTTAKVTSAAAHQCYLSMCRSYTHHSSRFLHWPLRAGSICNCNNGIYCFLIPTLLPQGVSAAKRHPNGGVSMIMQKFSHFL